MENKETGIGTDSEEKKSILNSTDYIELKDLLTQRLNDCGWRKKIKEMIRSILDERHVWNVSQTELAELITPDALALVPEDVRKEVLVRVREALQAPRPPVHE